MYTDRTEAGRVLADMLARFASENPVVLALPRGGVPVAGEVAARLDAPLDLLLVRKIGVPWQPELAIGAVIDGSQPIVTLNDDVVALAGISSDDINKEAEVQLKEIERRRALYMHGRRSLDVSGRVVIIVDDGIATGATMRVAVGAVQRRHPVKVVVAAPVAAADTVASLKQVVDEMVCPIITAHMAGIGAFYRDFHQLTDDEVVAILAKWRDGVAEPPHSET